jgi:calcineurin-like phosphoesterase family protein
MREVLIANHNQKVPSTGLTYHLGDIFWNSMTVEEAKAILDRLNGRHILIWGNHDETAEKMKNMPGCFVRTADVLIQRQDKGPKIFLSHYAHRVWPSSHKGSYHLFGHSHNALEAYGLSHDVGVDGNNFTPLSLAEVNKLMQEKVKQGFKDPLADKIEREPWDKSDRVK